MKMLFFHIIPFEVVWYTFLLVLSTGSLHVRVRKPLLILRGWWLHETAQQADIDCNEEEMKEDFHSHRSRDFFEKKEVYLFQYHLISLKNNLSLISLFEKKKKKKSTGYMFLSKVDVCISASCAF